jgi:hypothetical protein
MLSVARSITDSNVISAPLRCAQSPTLPKIKII